MRWKGRKVSENIDDRRGQTSGRSRGGGQPVSVGGGLGLGTIIIIVIMLLLGENPLSFLNQGPMTQAPAPSQNQAEGLQNDNRQGRADNELAEFVGVVLQDTEDVWNVIFRNEYRKDYPEPTLVLFDNYVQSACGTGSSAMGPFYCPGDSKIYIDLKFARELSQRFGAPGDFALAYVVAHEVGHHVQNLLGITDQVHSRKRRISTTEYNKLSVRLELQADFFAGVWARTAQQMKNFLDDGDIEEAMRAAQAIGDDMIQKNSQGYVVPDAFTHGTSEQRVRWFMKGYNTGDINQGDTFSARQL